MRRLTSFVAGLCMLLVVGCVGSDVEPPFLDQSQLEGAIVFQEVPLAMVTSGPFVSSPDTMGGGRAVNQGNLTAAFEDSGSREFVDYVDRLISGGFEVVDVYCFTDGSLHVGGRERLDGHEVTSSCTRPFLAGLVNLPERPQYLALESRRPETIIAAELERIWRY